MSAKYNKSKIMKLAHHLRKYEGYTMSQALKMAWSQAKRSEFYIIVEKSNVSRSFGYDVNNYADSLIDYYANRCYTGD